MPISTTDRGKILRYLELSITSKLTIDLLCDIVERTSEQMAQQTIELVRQLDANADEIRKASTGITKLDVIEWKENRRCDLQSYKQELVKQLANSIGYEVKIVYPF
jgi:recombinational DNA repair ATPase RecF